MFMESLSFLLNGLENLIQTKNPVSGYSTFPGEMEITVCKQPEPPKAKTVTRKVISVCLYIHNQFSSLIAQLPNSGPRTI